MKTIIRYIAAALAATAGLMSMSAQSDTIATVNEMSRIIITESPSGVKVTSSTYGEDSIEQVLYYQKYDSNADITTRQSTTIRAFDDNIFSISTTKRTGNRRHSWEAISQGIAVGLVDAVGQPGDMGLQWGKSFEISVVNAIGVMYKYRSWGVSLGLGLTWRNYRMSGGDTRMLINPEGGIGTGSFPEGTTNHSSRIKVFSLGIPLLWHQKAGQFALQAGAIVQFNTHASLLTKYTDAEGHSRSESTTSIHHRRVSVDYFGSITYRNIGLYTRYSAHNVLMGHNSPAWKPLTVGIALLM